MPGVGPGLLVGQVREALGGVAVQEGGLPHCVLEDTKEAVSHVVDDFGGSVASVGMERSFGPVEDVEDAVPETIVSEGEAEVDSEPEDDILYQN